MQTMLINLVAILLLFSKLIFAGINNLHTYDNIRSHDIFFEILQPEDLEYTYRLKPAKDFGGTFTDDTFKQRSRNLLVFAEPREACTALENPHELSGNIALIERGECTFVRKTIMAEEAGAIGAIITDTRSNFNEDVFIEMVHDNTSRNTNIPAGYLLGRNGRMIISTLDRYGLDRAIIKLPINLTFTPPELINYPPWTME
ncbi:PRADC1-like protein [Contarinia nasturtii]|uniref:PRADC1-like protein n=1 Tax=Contarinia nasturtii TaxID=265458 RepID=UPI0012D39C4E|nr:PRADC1-like protein [Contarinia nasturtii]